MSRFTTARGAAVIAAVAASALALSACSGSGGGGSESGGAADTSKLVIGLDSDQAALGYDPLRYGSGQRMFFEGIYDSLFVLDEDGTGRHRPRHQLRVQRGPDAADARPRHVRDVRRRNGPQRRTRQGEPRRPRQPRPVGIRRLRRRAARTRSSTSPSSTTTPSPSPSPRRSPASSRTWCSPPA